MVSVYRCIVDEHVITLVFLAVFVCALGSWTTMRLYLRAQAEKDSQSIRVAWLFLTGVAAGGSIWCTHFIAMLGYRAGAPVEYDPLLTSLSLIVSIVFTMVGFFVATSHRTHLAPEIGGIIIGAAIAAMHYTGMMGYKVDGTMTYAWDYVVVSVLLSIAFSVFAMNRTKQVNFYSQNYAGALLLTLAIVCLHFTGMTALSIIPVRPIGQYETSDAVIALGFSIGVVGLLIVGMGVVSHILDQSIRTKAHDEIQYMSLFDTLTGLPNRTYFFEMFRDAISQANEKGESIVLLTINLYQFQEVNDKYGYEGGDHALAGFARLLTTSLKDGEVIGRAGGDNFNIFKVVDDDQAASKFVEKIVHITGLPVHSDYLVKTMDARIGVAYYPTDASDAASMMVAANNALQRARRGPPRSVDFFKQSLHEQARRRRQIADDLNQAIKDEMLYLNYQGQTDIRDGTTIGYEVLARWQHPELGFISPGEFIPLAEQTGLIIPMGEWVLRQACKDAARWQEPYRIAVNISPVQIIQADLATLIEEILWQTCLPPSQLELEITETTLMAEMPRTIKVLGEVQRLGVSIAMDDFGTGYSSLAHLQAFPFNKIKLDRAFITKIGQSRETEAIVRAVLVLGKSLGIPILAEGIETEDQRDFLLEEGCYEVQGFLYNRPVRFEELGLALRKDDDNGNHGPSNAMRSG